MPPLLQTFIWLPLLGFVLTLMVNGKKERLVSGIAITVMGMQSLLLLGFIAFWLFSGYPILDVKHIVFFKGNNIEIFIDFYFDRITAIYAITGALIALFVTIFSKYYMHREEGFKRFFATLLLFFIGFNLVVFSGNFETLFLGWEILGICSFLLIAFYRDRYLPVKNGLKVISIYRFGDICLILTMWMSHQVWHENITFLKLNDANLVGAHLSEYQGQAIFIAIMLVIAAATKSAQLPFSTWLPRAMEGPTTSSAIFYGSLSVHLGVFLLLRTYPYWGDQLMIRILVIAMGIATSLLAAGMARVQSTVKTQIAYSSIAQIGLMFIEVALGLHLLALIHFVGNAFLRTYQLLISPSVLSYLAHNMFFHFTPAKEVKQDGSFLSRMRSSLYMLSLKEWNLDGWLYRLLWNPFKLLGKRLDFLLTVPGIVMLAACFLFGVYVDLNPSAVPSSLYSFMPVFFSLMALLLILRAFAERGSAIRAWMVIIGAQLLITLSIALYHEQFSYRFVLIFLSGSLLSSLVGLVCLQRLYRAEPGTDMNRFYGHVYEHRWLGFVFFLASLGLIGFPFTPTFIGIDLLFSHIHQQEQLLIVFTSLSFIFMELAVLRIYARTFLGQHVKTYHPIAYRSS